MLLNDYKWKVLAKIIVHEIPWKVPELNGTRSLIATWTLFKTLTFNAKCMVTSVTCHGTSLSSSEKGNVVILR